MRRLSNDPIEALVPSRVARELVWLCAIVLVFACMAVLALMEWRERLTARARGFIRDRRHRNDGLDVGVLDSMRRNQPPNPASRTGTFLHRDRG